MIDSFFIWLEGHLSTANPVKFGEILLIMVYCEWRLKKMSNGHVKRIEDAVANVAMEVRLHKDATIKDFEAHNLRLGFLERIVKSLQEEFASWKKIKQE